MSYYQLTISDYLEMKRSLGEELMGVSKSFVRIGYKLRVIAESGQYAADGYGSITEFAEKEYGLGKSTVSRFMAINEKYSVGGFSEELRPEFAGLGQSKLSEMLSLPDADLTMIEPAAARQDIRDLKAFNAMSEPVEKDSLSEFIEAFFQNRKDELNEIYEIGIAGISSEQLAEILCPAGAMSFRKNGYFMMLYENKVVVKQFGADPQELSWQEFRQRIEALFADAGKRTYEAHFGEPEQVKTTPEPEPEKTPEALENKEKSTVAPAQPEAKKTEKTAEKQVAGKLNTGGKVEQKAEEKEKTAGSAGSGESIRKSDYGEITDRAECDNDKRAHHCDCETDGSGEALAPVGGGKEGDQGRISEDVRNAVNILLQWVSEGKNREIEIYQNAAGECMAEFYEEDEKIYVGRK